MTRAHRFAARESLIFFLNLVKYDILCMYKADEETAYRGAAQLSVRAARTFAPRPTPFSVHFLHNLPLTFSCIPTPAAHVAASSARSSLHTGQL